MSDEVTVSDLLNLMKLSELRAMVNAAYLQPYVRGYWKSKKADLVKKLSIHFVIVNDGIPKAGLSGVHLSKVVEEYRINLIA